MTSGGTRRRRRRKGLSAGLADWFVNDGHLSGVRLLSVGLIVVAAAMRFVYSSSWSWFMDDWIYVQKAAQLPFLDFVLHEYNGHVMPAQFALVWVMTALAPLDYTVMVLVVTVLFAVMLVSWAVLLQSLFGDHPGWLAALGLVAFTPLLGQTNFWAASALQVYPLQAVLALMLWRVVLAHRSGAVRKESFVILGLMLIGLLFWQKTLLLAIPLVCVSWFLAYGRWRQKARSTFWLLLPAGLMCLAYLPWYRSRLNPSDPWITTARFDTPTWGQALESYASLWADVVVPSLLGGPWQRLHGPWAPVGALPGILSAAGLVLTAVVVSAVLVWRGRHWPVVVMVVGYVGVSFGLLIFTGRFPPGENDFIRGSRYVFDVLPVLLLATCLVLLPVDDGTRDPAPTSEPPHGSTMSRAGVRGSWAPPLLTAVVLSAVVGSFMVWSGSRPDSPKEWTSNLVADASAAGEVTVFDTQTPDHVLHPGYFPEYGTVSAVLAPLDLPLSFDRPAPNILIAGKDGHLYFSEVSAAATNVPGPTPDCGFLVRPGQTVRIPLTLDLYPYLWGVQLDYFTDRPGHATVDVGGRERELDLGVGLLRYLWSELAEMDHVEMSLSTDSVNVCVTRVLIGTIGPTNQRAVQSAP